MKNLIMTCAMGLLALAGSAVANPGAVGDFRVLPYLQNQAADAMSLYWFTAANLTSTITVTGPGLASPFNATINPVNVPELDYTGPEKALSPRPADMFPDASNWRHTVRVTGLQPATVYTYTVTTGASTFTGSFKTAPTTGTPARLRLAVMSDSETLVLGRTRFREWSRTVPQLAGSTGRPAGAGRGRDTYVLTEEAGFRNTVNTIQDRNVDLVVMPGDLVEGSTNEATRRWDEFWRHLAGSYDTLLSEKPLVAAIGNNCIFIGNLNGNTNNGIQRARQQWSAYFEQPGNGNPNFQDLYFRTDYGPVTIITLCSTGAIDPANDNVAPPVGVATGPSNPNRDTNRAWFVGYPFNDHPDFNIGTEQWNWAVQELAAARAAGQIIFVQWHHTPFSRGIHGSSVTSNQSGEAMRIYAPLMEQYKVAGVFCGHSEVLERSFIDTDGNGQGFNLWDVGAAGDGLRGVEDGIVPTAGVVAWRNTDPNFVMNPFGQWTADQSEPELWDGNTLLRGGKHYGFLEVNITPKASGGYRIEYGNYYNLPITDGSANFNVIRTERRVYTDRVILEGAPDALSTPACRSADIGAEGGAEGIDGRLDNNDFIVYINWFFEQDYRADIGTPGGAEGADADFDNNDLVVFINRFFSGCGV